MINLKACPRCGGDMLLEEVLGKTEMVCLQCGHRAYPAARVPSQLAVRAATKAA